MLQDEKGNHWNAFVKLLASNWRSKSYLVTRVQRLCCQPRRTVTRHPDSFPRDAGARRHEGLSHSPGLEFAPRRALCGLSSSPWTAVCPSLSRRVLARVLASAVHVVWAPAPQSRLLGSPCLISFICFPGFFLSCFLHPYFGSILEFSVSTYRRFMLLLLLDQKRIPATLPLDIAYFLIIIPLFKKKTTHT